MAFYTQNMGDLSLTGPSTRGCQVYGLLLVLSRLVLKEVSDFWSGHPLEAIVVPAPLHHRPHTIRDFAMNRSHRSVVIEHREDYRRLDPYGKRGLSTEDLGRIREDDYFVIRRPEDSAHLPNQHAEGEHITPRPRWRTALGSPPPRGTPHGWGAHPLSPRAF